MKKMLFITLLISMGSLMNAGKWHKKLKKIKKAAGIKAAEHVVHKVAHESKKAVAVVDHSVTKPIVNEVVKPVAHETKSVIHIVDKNLTQPVVDNVVKPVVSETKDLIGVVDKNVTPSLAKMTINPMKYAVEKPTHELTKPLEISLAHVRKEIKNLEDLTVNPFSLVKHEQSKISQHSCLKPAGFFLDALIDIQKKIVNENIQKILQTTHLDKELHILIKSVNEIPKLSKAVGFLLATDQDTFHAIIDYFLPLPLSAISLAGNIIETSNAIEEVTQMYNSIIRAYEMGNDSMTRLTLNEYASMLIKNKLVDERDQLVILLTITKDIGKGIDATIDWITEHRVNVPNHPIGGVDWR